MRNIKSISFALSLSLLIGVNKVRAVGWSLPADHGLEGDWEHIGIAIINWLLGFVITISIIAIIWGGIRYVSSSGNQDMAQGAKKTIQYALMGLLAAGLAYAFVNVLVTEIFNP